MAKCKGSCKKVEIETRFLRVFNAVQTKGGKDCRPPSWNQKLVALWEATDDEVDKKRNSLGRKLKKCSKRCECVGKGKGPKWTKWKDVYISGTFKDGKCKWKVPGAIQMKWRIRKGKCKAARG